MKKLIVGLSSVLLFIFAPATQGVEIQSPGMVESVSLFPSGAKVIRELQVNLEASGDHRIIFTGLPVNLDQSNLQARSPSSKLVFESLRFERVKSDEMEDSGEVIVLKTRLANLEQEIRQVKGEEDDLLDRIAFLEVKQSALRDGIAETGETALMGPMDANFEEILKLKLKLREMQDDWAATIDDLEASKDKIKAELNEAIQKQNALSGMVSIDLVASEAGSFRIQMEYFTGALSWRPNYWLNVMPDDEELRIDYQASINNGSHEDFEGINLTLLTSQPSSQSNPPYLSPVFLENPEVRRQVAMSATRVAKQSSDVFELSPFEVSADEGAAPGYQSAVAERLGTGFEVKLTKPVTIPARSYNHEISIKSEVVDAQVWSEVVPVLDTTAYLMAEVDNPFEYPLIPGNASLRVDGAITATGRLGYISPGDSFEAGFGPNPNIEVKKRDLIKDTSEKGIFGKDRVFERHYEYSFTSFMESNHEIKLIDRVPVSRDEEISVELEIPKRAEVEKDTGKFVRTFELNDGDTETKETRFTVKAPLDWSIRTNF